MTCGAWAGGLAGSPVRIPVDPKSPDWTARSNGCLIVRYQPNLTLQRRWRFERRAVRYETGSFVVLMGASTRQWAYFELPTNRLYITQASTSPNPG